MGGWMDLDFGFWPGGFSGAGGRDVASYVSTTGWGGDYLVEASFFASWRNAAIVAADWSLRFLFLGRRFLLVV